VQQESNYVARISRYGITLHTHDVFLVEKFHYAI
jgi:hypothetical protein